MQQDLADRFGVHIESFKNWERGATKPAIRHIPKIITFLGYNPESKPAMLPALIAYLRRRLGFTQEDLGKAINIDPVTLYRWEKGFSTPTGNVLQRIHELQEKTAITPR